MPGGVGTYLAGVVAKELKIRCRWEKPGLCGRASKLHLSRQDLADAELVGRAGVQAALTGHGGKAVALRPVGAEPKYELRSFESMAGERHVPPEWIDDSDLSVTEPFKDYLRSCIGDLVDYALLLMDSAPKVR